MPTAEPCHGSHGQDETWDVYGKADPPQEMMVLAEEQHRQLLAAIQRLPIALRAVARLRLRGATFRQIGQQRGVTGQRAEQLWKEAAVRLRKALG